MIAFLLTLFTWRFFCFFFISTVIFLIRRYSLYVCLEYNCGHRFSTWVFLIIVLQTLTAYISAIARAWVTQRTTNTSLDANHFCWKVIQIVFHELLRKLIKSNRQNHLLDFSSIPIDIKSFLCMSLLLTVSTMDTLNKHHLAWSIQNLRRK